MAEAVFRGGSPTMVPITPSGYSLDAGQIKVLNSRCLIAHNAIADGETGDVSVPNGGALYEIPKGTTGAALTQEQAVYWDDTNNVANTNNSLPLVGRVLSGTMTTAAGTILVRNAEA